MFYSIISELSFTENDVTSNYSRHYNHQNFNINNNENNNVKSFKVLILLNKDLKKIFYLSFVIQSSNTSSIYNCSETSQQLARIISLMSSFFSVIAAETACNNNFLKLSAEKLIKLTIRSFTAIIITVKSWTTSSVWNKCCFFLFKSFQSYIILFSL